MNSLDNARLFVATVLILGRANNIIACIRQGVTNIMQSSTPLYACKKYCS